MEKKVKTINYILFTVSLSLVSLIIGSIIFANISIDSDKKSICSELQKQIEDNQRVNSESESNSEMLAFFENIYTYKHLCKKQSQLEEKINELSERLKPKTDYSNVFEEIERRKEETRRRLAH